MAGTRAKPLSSEVATRQCAIKSTALIMSMASPKLAPKIFLQVSSTHKEASGKGNLTFCRMFWSSEHARKQRKDSPERFTRAANDYLPTVQETFRKLVTEL